MSPGDRTHCTSCIGVKRSNAPSITVCVPIAATSRTTNAIQCRARRLRACVAIYLKSRRSKISVDATSSTRDVQTDRAAREQHVLRGHGLTVHDGGFTLSGARFGKDVIEPAADHRDRRRRDERLEVRRSSLK